MQRAGVIVARSVVLLAALIACAPASASPFTLGQLARGGGCARALSCSATELGAEAVAISPDGAFVYGEEIGRAAGTGGVETYRRDPATGALHAIDCVRTTGEHGCVIPRHDSEAVRPSDMAMSADGRLLFVAESTAIFTRAKPESTITAFRRDAGTGRLERAGCVGENGAPPDCSAGRFLAGVDRLAVSPDGRNVYALAPAGNPPPGGDQADAPGTIAIVAVDPATAALTQTGCVSEDGSDGACADGSGVSNAQDLIVSADGSELVLASAQFGLFRLSRDADDGKVAPAGCVSARGYGPAPYGPQGICARGLRDAFGLATTPSGELLAGSSNGLLSFAKRTPARGRCLARCHLPQNSQVGAVAVTPDAARIVLEEGAERGYSLRLLDRDPSGRLRSAGCIGSATSVEAFGCSIGEYSPGRSLALSPDGTSAYLAGDYSQGVIAYGPAVAVRARRRGVKSVTVDLVCPRERAPGCRGRVRLMVVGRLKGSRLHAPRPREPAGAKRPYSLQAGQHARFDLGLNARGARARELAIAAGDATGLTLPTYAPVRPGR